MTSDFQNIDTNIYKSNREKYLPKKIRILFVAESPPAFKGPNPIAYFYFDNVSKGDSLFYTIIKAVYDLDFKKSAGNRIFLLNKFKNDGFFLVDSVEYPINKDRNGNKIDNFKRERIIHNNQEVFESYLDWLKKNQYIDNSTKTILIKETVYNIYHNNKSLAVLNNKYIGFPRYIKDKEVVDNIKNLIKTAHNTDNA